MAGGQPHAAMRKLFTVDHSTNGKGPVQFAWNRGGNILACCGVNRQLSVYDRQGKAVDQKTLPNVGACLALEWDSAGETLAVMQQGSSVIILWNHSGKKLEFLETSMKDLTWMKWNRVGPQLAVGTLRGNVLLYNKKTLKKMPIMGKHTKRISCGAWSNTGRLALGGDDKQLTINNSDGDLIDSTPLKFEPSSIQFARMKSEGQSSDNETTISVNMGGKTLLLYDSNETENCPYELAFLPKYGNIVAYRWFGDGYILIGFSTGHVIVISTHLKEIGQEVSYVVPHSEHLNDLTYCAALQKGASIGDNCVQIFSMDEISNIKTREADKYDLDNEYGALRKVEWTDDGQILTVSSKNGNIHTFLTRIPVMHDYYGTQILYLTSLREMCVRDVVTETDVAKIAVEIEPTFVSLGPEHAAVGMNNCVWYYLLQRATKNAKVVSQRSYLKSVDFVKLSTEYSAVMCEGKVTLHPINQQEQNIEPGFDHPQQQDERKQQKLFPEKEGDVVITTVSMTPKYMLYGTSHGSIVQFSLDDWTIISEYRSTIGIRSVFPNPVGTRAVFIDDTNEAYIYSSVNDSTCKVDRFSVDTSKIMWDVSEWGTFVGADSKHLTSYVYAPNSRWGAKCGPVCKYQGKTLTDEIRTTDKPFGFVPILVHNGGVICQMPSGTMPVIQLVTHQNISLNHRLSGDQVFNAFYTNLSLHKLDVAWQFAQQLNLNECWYALGDKALHLLDVELAIRVYRVVQQPAMVIALDQLLHVNEKSLLLGHVAMLFKNFNEAQNHFMKSSCPILALEMRRDLMHWNEALELSEKLSPESVPHISREYASQLEFRGEHQQALEMFHKGVVQIDAADGDHKNRSLRQHNEHCQAGIARITIRMGDISRGFQIAMQTDSPTMATECAQIFEELKQWTEAAQLYEKAGSYDLATQIYICQTKNLKAASTLMPHINSHKIQGLYAAAKEKEGAYKEANDAYAKAEDWDNVVRLTVEQLNDISSAYEIVRRTKSAEAAALVAKYCRKDGNPETAIEFLLLAKKTDEAFELASTTNNMATYSSILGANGSTENYLHIAEYYEGKSDFSTAADYYFKCHSYDKALQKYLEAVSSLGATMVRAADAAEVEKKIDSCLNSAIAVVGEAKLNKLSTQMIRYLTAEENDAPRDPKYLFSLYMALGKYEKGSDTAIIIARTQRELGHYRVAHRLLFQTYKELEKHGMAVPSELRWNLMLLHSYLIAKPLMKTLNNHDLAARMLIRVAKNIPKFPKHITQILTSCVTECNKAGFDKSAFTYAKQLVTSDRKGIPDKHRKRIDTIVRKPGYYSKNNVPGKRLTEADLTDPPEPVGPCPFCSVSVPLTMLDCPRCKNNIPYCVSTGYVFFFFFFFKIIFSCFFFFFDNK